MQDLIKDIVGALFAEEVVAAVPDGFLSSLIITIQILTFPEVDEVAKYPSKQFLSTTNSKSENSITLIQWLLLRDDGDEA